MNESALLGKPRAKVPSDIVDARVTFDKPLTLDCGAELPRYTIAYQTYGKLNAARSNAILICHALSGDQYVASPHPITGKPGWWNETVGPGRTKIGRAHV